jgi:SPP1 gp7 family putative phage head morphogenesis protein
MPVAIPRGLRLGLIEPIDAIKAFERRNLLLPSFRWEDVFASEHARGVAVAGVTKLNVLQLFADTLAASIASGSGLREFQKAIMPALVKEGYWGNVEVTDPLTGEQRTTKFDKARLQLIHDINARQSYAAGRWSRIEANKKRQPLVLYRTMRDERVRASHAAWDNLVLPVESPFWQTHYPPNGWRCRCTAFAVSEKDLAKFAKDGQPFKRSEPPLQMVEFKNKRTGETVEVPRGIDPGFNYNPGQRPFAGLSLREVNAGDLGDYAGTALAPSLRLPPPRAVNPAVLMPKGLPDQDYIDAFLAEFRGPEFTDVAGENLLVSDELFKDIAGNLKITKRDREQFVRLIAQTIQQPDEIWMLEQDHKAKGKLVLRRRYISRFSVEGEAKPVISVFEVGADGWRCVTGYQAQAAGDADTMIDTARVGELVYRRVP